MVSSSKGKRAALGAGLDALLPDPLEGEFFLCPIEEIHPSPSQPRQDFSEESLDELAASIRVKGLIQPVIVRQDQGGYELIAGERRWRAAQRAGITEVPTILREADEEEVLELALIENLQRQDLNPVEEAHAYQVLTSRLGLTQDQLATRIGKSRVAVANTLRLLSLPERATTALRKGRITAGHARAILSLEDDADRLGLLEEILRKNLSVRQAEAIGRHPKPKPKSAPRPDPDLLALERRLGRRLGTRVGVQQGRKKGTGRITIQYESLDDFDRILALIEGA